MSPENPALRPDGTLKDASEIEWLNSPSDETVPLLGLCSGSDIPDNIRRIRHPTGCGWRFGE